MINTDEQIFNLVQQWCHAPDKAQADEALRRIVYLTKCTSLTPAPLSEEQMNAVMQWLQEHCPIAYLWAVGKQWVGHPATVWGLSRSPDGRFLP